MAATLLLALCQNPVDLARDQAVRFEPHVVPASDEARAAMARFEVPAGMKVELVAAEPSFANPVAFWPARDGSFYVAETFRHHQGVTDIRDHMDWLDDDLAARTVDDRVAYFRKRLGPSFPECERAFDRISLLRDTDGDGVVDVATVFSDRFAGAAAGICAGVLENAGDVYVTCIPSLWKLRDTDGDGRADEEVELSTGYGVHVALLGHDLHGLAIGPDQRLYFSIGDRAFDVKTASGELRHPQAGAVLRCELDGSKLEVFATGLRNPQELAFDDLGDLFTGDNNSDGGDRARLVHVVEGGDSGWRQSYQWVTEPSLRGPWNDEKLWYPHFAGQAAYVVPPIANFADGPSGLAIDPGTGFSDKYRGRLFLCDFRGDANASGVHAIELEKKNATYALKGSEHVLWKVLATDCDFGPDGALYAVDWTQGWSQTGKGRLYRLYDPAVRDAKIARLTKELLAKGVASRGDAELVDLLAFPDRRVRQSAEFELVARGDRGRAALEGAAKRAPDLRARLHALWGLGVLARKSGGSTDVLLASLTDDEGEVRAQAARVLGDLREARAFPPLLARLTDDSPRVRFHAAIALGRLANPSAFQAVVQLVRETKDGDPVLRHAAIFALAGCGRAESLVTLGTESDVNVRIAAVVALRRHASPLVARFLADFDPLVQTEAARAIDDLDLAAARADLASVLAMPKVGTYDLARRAINACFREGTRPKLLADHALRDDQDARTRREALDRLAQWNDPSPRDAVSSAWRPWSTEELAARRSVDVAGVLAAMTSRGVVDAPEAVVEGWLRAVEANHVSVAGPAIEPLVLSSGAKRASKVRCAALRALASLAWPKLRDVVQIAIADPDGDLRAEALDALTKIAPADARPIAERVLADGEMKERRAACRILGSIADPAASAAIAKELDRLAAGLFPVELAFDLVAAAKVRKDPALDAKLATIERRDDRVLAPYLDALFGGDREAGKRVFREKSAVACLRCHKVEWDEGGTVGPDLRGVGKRLARLQILESILLPNRHVSPGYRNTVFALKDERVVEARVLSEDETKLRVIDADAKTFDVAKAEIEARRDGLSAMPEGFDKLLSPAEVRDLIEYLCGI